MNLLWTDNCLLFMVTASNDTQAGLFGVYLPIFTVLLLLFRVRVLRYIMYIVGFPRAVT